MKLSTFDNALWESCCGRRDICIPLSFASHFVTFTFYFIQNGKNSKKSYFSDSECNYFLWERFSEMFKKKISWHSSKHIFALMLSVKTTPSHLPFPPPCMFRFFLTCSYPNFWGIQKAPRKKFHMLSREMILQSLLICDCFYTQMLCLLIRF